MTLAWQKGFRYRLKYEHRGKRMCSRFNVVGVAQNSPDTRYVPILTEFPGSTKARTKKLCAKDPVKHLSRHPPPSNTINVSIGGFWK